jgi:DNA-binding NarL/FixJ family response regulator
MQSSGRPRLVIADNHRLFAEACKGFLEPEFDVVGITSDSGCLLKLVDELRPDVLILEIGMPGLNGLDGGEEIKRSLPSTRVIYVTMNPQPEIAAEAFRRGALGYVSKASKSDELRAAIRKALMGESYLSSSISKATVGFLVREGRHSRAYRSTTKRQRDVLQLLADGKSMKEIAGILGTSPGTVAFHKYGMMERLGLRTSAELLQYAFSQRLVA